MSNLGELGLNPVEARQNIAAQLEATRDLEGIENISKNRKLLSGTRKGVTGLPENMNIGNVNKLFRALRSGMKISELTAKDLPTLKPSSSDKPEDTLKLNPKEVRTRKTTGTIDGEFVYGPVKRWARRLNETPEKWGTDAQGNQRSLKGFVKWLNKSYSSEQLRAKQEGSRPGRGETHAGHGTSAEEYGTNAPSNLAPQPARNKIRGLIGNLDIKGKSLHSLKELQDAGVDGGTLEGAFQEYMNEGEKNILSHKDLKISDQSKILHGVDDEGKALNAQALEIEARRELENRAGELQIHKANPQTAKIKANRLFQVTRHAARTAGQSNNPLANIGGDAVGVIMDGAAFIQDPKNPENLVDLALSGGQLATSIAAAGLTALPVPGARPGAFFLMKAGDNLGKIEKLWNFARPGFNKTQEVMKLKPGSRNKRSELKSIQRDLKLGL